MDLDYILISKATKHMNPPEGYRWIQSTEVRKDGDMYCEFGVWKYTDLVGDVPHNFKYARRITRDDMTPERRLEIEQAANMYGSANCWAGTTGTLATMIRELIDEINIKNLHIAAQLRAIQDFEKKSFALYTFDIGIAGEYPNVRLTLEELVAECNLVTDDRLRFLNIYKNETYQDFFYFRRCDNPQFSPCMDIEVHHLSKSMADICSLGSFRKSCEVNNEQS